jgi:glycosyltransferase involved in cell wall biosynthesis
MSTTAAVIITTYNQPRWLEKVLWGYAAQDRVDFDVVIADDGSTTPTWAVIEKARSYFGKRLQHVWHEDTGFRKCEILNRAITRTDADYLIFTDGDCIPRADFVSTHIGLAEPRRFLSGGVIWLPKATSDAITRADVLNGHVAQAKWLRAHGWRGGRRRLRLVRNEIAATVLDTVSPTGATFNGHNASVWREALVAVNGFDAEMGYGGLDRALGERLENYGYRGKRVRHRAVCFHLDHERPYRKPEIVQRNREIRARIRESGEVRAKRGIAELATETVNRP